MKRREFINLTTTSGLHSSIEMMAHEKPLVSYADPKFQLKIMATNWGWGGSLDTFCAAAKKEGYDGIEMWWPNETKDQKELFAALDKHDLEIGYL